jgi:hypothetical protein
MELFLEIISAIVFSLLPKSKREKNMEKLKKEEWFLALWEDYRYGHILTHSKIIQRILGNTKLVEQLLTQNHEREQFIELVKQEHEDYVRLG